MPSKPETRVRFKFGPYDVNTSTGEVLNGGVRIKLSGQPLKMLLVLLARPGEVVTREELRDEIWPNKAFMDFDHGLHAGVNRLRRALNDSIDAPRYIETVPTRGYRFIGTLDDPEPVATVPAAGVHPPVAPARWWTKSRIAATALALTAACAAGVVGSMFLVPSAPKPIWKLTQISSSPGADNQAPALSPDGKLLAYSSNENSEGQQDLYIKQISGGRPVRLTFDGLDNTAPQFSPDGTKLVFRSSRHGGGIYEMPAWGGSPRLIAADGRDPAYSPDGSEIVYWTGAVSVGQTIPGSGAVWISPVNGGPARRIASALSSARYPIWSPDGKKVLLVGYGAANALEGEALDWWLAPADGGPAVKTGATPLLLQAGLGHQQEIVTPVPNAPKPSCWSSVENRVSFSRRVGDTQNIWQLAISPKTGAVEGALERLTTGSDNEVNPSCVGNTFVFATEKLSSNIWSFPLNPRSEGSLHPVAIEQAEQRNPSFSKDGRFLTFLSTRSGPANVLLLELASGKEQVVAPSSLVQGIPAANSKGDRVAYTVYEQRDRRTLYVSAPGEVPRRICNGCLRATDWSAHDDGVLVFAGNPFEIDYVEVASRRKTTLLRHPAYSLLYGKFSPDGRWISFTARLDSARARIFIAPYPGIEPMPESTWISITDVDPDDYALWSPDGTTLYFSSPRDGYTCLWGQKINPKSHHAAGDIFPVRHFHKRLRSFHKGWSVSNASIAIALAERNASIWMMSKSTGKAR
jgi:eukaryotic-like serine/threonine-protein kinase